MTRCLLIGRFLGTVGLAIVARTAICQNGYPPSGFISGGGFYVSGDITDRGQKPEPASKDQIAALVAKLGPGVYHRLSSCIPPPPWGTGSPADQAAAQLVKIGTAAVPFVLGLAKTENDATRALVIEILSRIPDARAVPALIDACLHDASDNVRVSAVEGLAWTNDSRAAPALIDALRDKNKLSQFIAAQALSRHPQVKAIEPLVELMKHAAESFRGIAPTINGAMVAESAAPALGAIGPKAYPSILELMASPDPAVRKVGGIALTECNDRRAIPKLIEMCADSDDMTRSRAAQSLWRWRDPSIVAVLTKLMHTGGGNAAGSAAMSLARMGGAGLDPLFAAAKDADPQFREMASSSFIDIGDRKAASGLVEILKSPDPRVREQALFVLSMWADPRAIPQILDMTKESDVERRRLAVGMLGSYDDTRHPEIIQPLLTAFTDKHEWVRSQAAAALFRKRDKRIVPAMKLLLKSPIKDVPPLAEMVLKQYHP